MLHLKSDFGCDKCKSLGPHFSERQTSERAILAEDNSHIPSSLFSELRQEIRGPTALISPQ